MWSVFYNSVLLLFVILASAKIERLEDEISGYTTSVEWPEVIGVQLTSWTQLHSELERVYINYIHYSTIIALTITTTRSI